MYKKQPTKRQKQVIVILECTDYIKRSDTKYTVGEAMIIIYGGSDTYTHGDDNDIIERFEN